MKTNTSKIKQGLVICYIGNGKGKTTAAMGLAARASGAGLNVFILQFVKAQKPKNSERLKPGEWPVSSEVAFLDSRLRGNDGGSSGNDAKKIGRVICEQVGAGFVGILGDQKERSAHEREALKGLEMAREGIQSGEYQVVILDEILSAVDLKLLSQDDVIHLLETKPDKVHVVMTGHKKYPKIFKYCDTVTEMKMVKHVYYEGGVAVRGLDF
jgi:cob(I)alamin adenosyltransferase